MGNVSSNEVKLQEFIEAPDSGPVVMVNLLRFKMQTEGGESGVKVYERYVRNAAEFLTAVGGRLLWKGAAHQLIIGSKDQRWDRVLLIEYPSRKAFLQMVENPAFMEVQQDRVTALEETILLATTTEGGVLVDRGG